MRLVLSQTESARYLTGDPEAWRIEEALLSWATDAGIEEPVVVVLHTGENAFVFTLGGDV